MAIGFEYELGFVRVATREEFVNLPSLTRFYSPATLKTVSSTIYSYLPAMPATLKTISSSAYSYLPEMPSSLKRLFYTSTLRKGMDFIPADAQGQYRLVIDDQPQVNGVIYDLEFVSKVFDDNASSKQALINALLAVKADQLKMANLVSNATKGFILATDLNTAADPSFAVSGIASDFLKGRLQITAGLSLNALYRIRSGEAYERFKAEGPDSFAENAENFRLYDQITKEDLRGILRQELAELFAEAGMQVPARWKTVQAVVNQLAPKTLNIGKDLIPLTTIVDLITNIPVTSYSIINGAPYPKSLTGSLMHRTDFASLLGLLPQDQQNAIADHPNEWANLLLTVIRESVPQAVKTQIVMFQEKINQEQTGKEKGHLEEYQDILQQYEQKLGKTIELTDPVFCQDAFSLKAVPDYSGGLTLKEWFDGLSAKNRKDYLTAKNYPSLGTVRKNADAKALARQAEYLESIGGYGNQMDPAWQGEQLQRPIFEFRTLPDLMSAPFAEMVALFWDYIKLAHATGGW